MVNNDTESFDAKAMVDEAKKRWGETDAFKQSANRTKNWTQDDYSKEAERSKTLFLKLADTMDQGPESDAFQALIQQQFESVNRFYDCSIDMFKNLGEMYASDPKFKQAYDSYKPGLAHCMNEAIKIYCVNHK